MFAKRLLQKAVHHSQSLQNGSLKPGDLDPRLIVHYGIPTTASLLAIDSIQRLLAIGTLDGRIKVIGGDGIEVLLVSPKQLPYKNLAFLQNQGFLVGILNDNDIQVWNLDSQSLACCLQWESNITAFSVISGSQFMYVGNEHGLVSVMKYETEGGKLLKLPYTIPANSLREAAGHPHQNEQPIVGVLPQPGSSWNRVLIAFEDGLFILWDASEAKIVFVGGGKDLQLKDGSVDYCTTNGEASDINDIKEHSEDKEISALSWASSDGSILAVGYVDGDILFWNMSHAVSPKVQAASLSSKNVVKLQLSSAERRLPVIVLQWSKSTSQKSNNGCDGQLFIYGGDEIGAEEVLTVLTLEWTPGLETVRCSGRADLTLTGSFADMSLLPTVSSNKVDLFVLMSPGQLQFYESVSLTTSLSSRERRPSISSIEYPALIPMADPSMTVAKLVKLTGGLDSVKLLTEAVSVIRVDSSTSQSGSHKWPLTGGVPIEPSTTIDIFRLYLAGYSDGTVRMWNATNPVLSYIGCVDAEVEGVKVAGTTTPVLKLDFFPNSLMLVVGNECGLVRVYDLKASSDGSSFHFVTESTHEVHTVTQQKRPYCRAIFSLGSTIHELKFSNSGEKLVVGMESGRVAVFNMSSMSILFSVDGCSSSRVASLIWKEQPYDSSSLSSDQSEKRLIGSNIPEELIFILSQDSKIHTIDGTTGRKISNHPFHLKKESVALTIYVIEGLATESSRDQKLQESSEDPAMKPESTPESGQIKRNENEQHLPESSPSSSILDSFILLCCEDSLRLYSTKSVIQGNRTSIQKVRYAKPCCWTTIFKNCKNVGIISLLQTGVLEIRSLPDLQLVEEVSLMSMLRWSFKANMNKTMSSDGNGNIVLANGSEFAFLSVVASDSEQLSLKNLPSLHDKVVAAAADAALNFSLGSNKKQGSAPGILGGLVKSFKVGKAAKTDCIAELRSNVTHLDSIFSKSLFPETSLSLTDDQEAVLLDIDDIEIDENDTPFVAPPSSDGAVFGKEKKTSRDKLLEGGTETDVKPRLRTAEEIRAAYRKAGDASSAASQARNKLMERQEKLERISQRTAELQSGAEDFASLANELVKTMENRKWWHI